MKEIENYDDLKSLLIFKTFFEETNKKIKELEEENKKIKGDLNYIQKHMNDEINSYIKDYEDLIDFLDKNNGKRLLKKFRAIKYHYIG